MTDWDLLRGSREWLAGRLGRGTNLVWWELVRQIAVAERKDEPGELGDPVLVGRMFELLQEFLVSRRG